MKKIIIFLLFVLPFSTLSQNIDFGLSGGGVLSSQSLTTESLSNAVGVDWNSIGGLPYDVDSYIGYNGGVFLDLYFDLSSEEEDKTIKRNLGIRTGFNYSSQGVIIEDVNRTKFTINLVYYQVPILIYYKVQKFNFFIGPQLHFLQDVNTTVNKSTILSTNATSSAIENLKFEKSDYKERDTNLVFGFGYEIYNGLSIQLKSLRSIRNTSMLSDEIWKNKSLELSINFNVNSIL